MNSYLALYTYRHDRIIGKYMYKNVITTVPYLMDDVLTKKEAVEIAKSKEDSHLRLQEVLEVNIVERANILSFYG